MNDESRVIVGTSGPVPNEGDPLSRLTPPQLECLTAALKNRSSKAIAKATGYTESTVNTYMSKASATLGCRGRREAVLLFEQLSRQNNPKVGFPRSSDTPPVAQSPGPGMLALSNDAADPVNPIWSHPSTGDVPVDSDAGIDQRRSRIGGVGRLFWGEHNALSIRQRLAWLLVMPFLIILAVTGLASALETLTRLLFPT